MQIIFRVSCVKLAMAGVLSLAACMPVVAMAQTPTAASTAPTAVAPVRIFAWAKHDGCEIRYTYTVQNNGAYPIRRILIGLYQPDTGNGAANLNLLPKLNGRALWLASGHTISPAGWNVKAYFPEDSKKFALEWISAAYHAELWPGAPAVPLPALVSPADNPVLAGTTVDKFSVQVSSIDHAYTQSRANLDYGGTSLNVQIEKGDTIAPTLDLARRQVEPKPNDSWAEFNVTAKVTDNYDLAPSLTRPTVVASQLLTAQDYSVEAMSNGWRLRFRNVEGRAYQAQFVATDASGNATLRTLDYVGKDPVLNVSKRQVKSDSRRVAKQGKY